MKFKKKILEYKIELIVFLTFLIYLVILRIMIPILRGRGVIGLGNGDIDWDFYIRMSRDITSIFKSEIITPFCYRPLMPLLSGLLPFNLEFNYALIIFISTYLTGIVLYFTLRIYFTKKISIIGLVFFCYLNYIVIIHKTTVLFDYGFFHYYFYDIYNVDSLALLFIMLCFYSILSSKKKMYSIFLVLGVLTKEIVLITIPVFLIYTFLKIDKKSNKKETFYKFSKNFLYIIPGILSFTLLHIIVKPDSLSNWIRWYIFYERNEYFSIEVIMIFLRLRYNAIMETNALYEWTIGTWGFIIIILCFFNTKKDMFNWIKLYGIFMILTYSQMFLGIATTKFFYYGFFPMILLALSGLNRINEAIKNSFNFNLSDILIIPQ